MTLIRLWMIVTLICICHMIFATAKGIKNGAVEKRTAAWAARAH